MFFNISSTFFWIGVRPALDSFGFFGFLRRFLGLVNTPSPTLANFSVFAKIGNLSMLHMLENDRYEPLRKAIRFNHRYYIARLLAPGRGLIPTNRAVHITESMLQLALSNTARLPDEIICRVLKYL